MARGKASGRRGIISLRSEVVPAVLTGLSLVILLAMLDALHIGLLSGLGSSDIIFASFAASAVMLFMTPHVKGAKPQRFVKSYIIGAVVGFLGRLMIPFVGLYISAFIVITAVALLFVVFDAFHPAGAGIAFAFVLFDVGWTGIVIVIAGVLLLLVTRLFLEKAVYELERDVEALEREGRDRLNR